MNAGEPTELTEWEARERAGHLAHETADEKVQRAIAKNPDTLGETLEQLAYTVDDDVLDYLGEKRGRTCLLAEAVTAHPNTPVRSLGGLLFLPYPFTPFSVRGFCRNPIAPLVALELPDFWERKYTSDLAEKVLASPTAPRVLVSQLAQNPDKVIAEVARLHVALAGKVQTQAEGEKALTDFWRAFCVEESRKPNPEGLRFLGQEWHEEMVELKLAPTWTLGDSLPRPFTLPPKPYFTDTPTTKRLTPESKEKLLRSVRSTTPPDELVALARETGDLESVLVRRLVCRHKNAPPGIRAHARQGFIASAGDAFALGGQFGYGPRVRIVQTGSKAPYNHAAFVKFVVNLHGAFPSDVLYKNAQSSQWMERLNAALGLPMTDAPFDADPWNRSPRMLVNHLARDGNRFVRWAAQTRLDTPDFVFTWAK